MISVTLSTEHIYHQTKSLVEINVTNEHTQRGRGRQCEQNGN